MSRYDGPKEYKPISSWGYVGYTILFAIPALGQILLILFSIFSKNINRRNFARHYLCLILLAIILLLGSVIFTRLGIVNLTESMKQWSPTVKQVVETIENIIPFAQKKTTEDLSVVTKKENITEKAIATEKPTATKEPVVTDKPASHESQSTNGIRKEVKDAIDGYEAFFKEYVDYMKKISSSTSLDVLMEYAELMSAYEKNMEEWEKFEQKYDDMNDAELRYYTEATLRIEKMLLNAY